MFVTLLLLFPLAHAEVCASWNMGSRIAEIADTPIVESSGLLWSRSRPGVWFTHNDAGGVAEIYAFSLEGVYLGAHAVGGAAFRDWEDISSGPCPDGVGSCIYIGDIGDNGRSRGDGITVYCVREPAEGASAPVIASWSATYPVGPQDAEALAVHPRTGRVYVITKTPDGAAGVYRFPEPPYDGTAVLEHVATLALTGKGDGERLVTGADWEMDGDRLVLSTYGKLWEWTTDPCDPDAHWSTPPVGIYDAPMAGTESIAYTPEGDLVTTREGNPMAINRKTCAKLAPGGGPCGDTGDTSETGDTDDTSKPKDTSTDSGDNPVDSCDGCGADSDGDNDSDPPADGRPPGSTKERGCGCNRAVLLLPLGLGLRRRRHLFRGR